MKKDCIVVMLPTDKGIKSGDIIQLLNDFERRKSGPFSETTGEIVHKGTLSIALKDSSEVSYHDYKAQNLYICSTDEIKEGDWYVDDTNTVRQSITSDKEYWAARKDYKKVIATTDTSLHFKGEANGTMDLFRAGVNKQIIASIPQSFIELYIKKYNEGSSLTNVKVEYPNMNLEGTWNEMKPKLNGNEIVIHTQQETFTREELMKAVGEFFMSELYKGTDFKEWFNSKY